MSHPEDLKHEIAIIWLEDITHLAYVRVRLDRWCSARQRRPWFRSDENGRLVGYAVLSPDAPNTGQPRMFARRLFWLRDDDRTRYRNYPAYGSVVPSSLQPGLPGRLARRRRPAAVGCVAAEATQGDCGGRKP